MMIGENCFAPEHDGEDPTAVLVRDVAFVNWLSYRPWLPRIVILALALLIRLVLLNRPFLPNNEGTATGIQIIHAMNFARYGPWGSRFAGVLNTGVVPKEEWTYYAHHPPLVPLATAAVYRVTGVSAWSSRLIPAVFSVATTLLLYEMAFRRFGLLVASVAALFYLGAPMSIAFGGMPDYINAQLAFFMVATIDTYIRWRETNRRLWLGFTTLCFAAGALTDWPMFYLVPVVGAHHWVTSGRRVLPTVMLVTPALLLLAALIAWMNSIDGSRAFSRQFAVRMSGHGLTWADWFQQVLVWNVTRLHTPVVVVLSIVYVSLTLTLIRRKGLAGLRGYEVPTMLLAVAALHLVVGRTGNMQPWWVVVITAPMSLSSAIALQMLSARFDGRGKIRAFIVVGTLAVFVTLSIPAASAAINEEWSHTRTAGYTLRDLGEVIHAISQPEDGVLTSDYLNDPTLWFYADRQLRTQVVEARQLDDFLRAGPYQLAFGYVQKDGERPRWFVLPPPHRKLLPRLVKELDARFSHREWNGYAVYRLR